MLNHLISIAPMMDCTDRHDRYFLRLISPHVLLYTEMITSQAIIHGDVNYLLGFHPLEHPLALQLGGSDPKELAQSAKRGEDFGYDEINLNVGCPSDRVQQGKFGACLMLQPELVADCIHSMIQTVKIPVTVKCRIGVDNQDSYESLFNFIKQISNAGCKTFIIHARKAWLTGLSPKENRDIPPLQYATVHKIKQDFPELTIIINGGIKTVAEIQEQLQFVDGVMIGREAYANPYLLADIEKNLFDHTPKTRYDVIEQLLPYVDDMLKNKIKLSSITRHILGLFRGQKGGRLWRRYLSEQAHLNPNIETIRMALAAMQE